jgi:hypothetical protein
MNSVEVLSLALTSLGILVFIHFTVFWVVRTMFPPAPPSAPSPAPAPVTTPLPAPVYVQPPETKQELNVPTYEPPVQMETPRKEIPGTTDIAALQDSTAV